MAAASVAAKKVSDDLLAQFMDAHDDQMARIEELSQEMRGRLIGLQNTVGAGLDAPWHTALTHIEEAGRRPSHREQELELARKYLIKAWGVAKSLLERDPRSMDPAALRCPLVAQQIAAVYSFLGEPQNTVHWLEAAYIASRNQLGNQIGAVHGICAEKMKGAKERSPGLGSHLMIEVWSRNPKSTDPLWVRAPSEVGAPQWYGYSAGAPWSRYGHVRRDLGFEGRIGALIVLDAEAQLLRLSCLDAGANGTALRPGTEPRSANADSAREGERRALMDRARFEVIVVFDATTAAVLTVKYTEPDDSPIWKRIDDRYQEILPFTMGDDFFRLPS